jgi:hypothetical protein
MLLVVQPEMEVRAYWDLQWSLMGACGAPTWLPFLTI